MAGLGKQAARRFVRRVIVALAVVTAAVVGLNNLTFHYVLKPENQSVAQLLGGWERQYKPIMYDEIAPEAVAVGASWVRDVFDPARVGAITGERFFNYGTSGGTAHEARMFLLSGLKAHTPRRVYINMDSLIYPKGSVKYKYGYDQRILRVNEDGTDNPFFAFSRFYTRNFSGAAVSYNYRVLSSLWALNRGAAIEEAITSYEQLDFTALGDQMATLRSRYADGFASPTTITAPPVRSDIAPAYAVLTEMLGTLCQAGVDAHIYFTPHSILNSQCSARIDGEIYVYDVVLPILQACASQITFHSFNYPNFVTFDGVFDDKDRSTFYRPDGHPRPTVGDLIVARIHGLDIGDHAPAGFDDFGADLMALSRDEAVDWLSTHNGRCRPL